MRPHVGGTARERSEHEHLVDAVVHFAGYKAAGDSIYQPGPYFKNNVAANAILFDTLQRCRVTRLVFSSSCAV
jgi:UDP-glucose 4-epimerase